MADKILLTRRSATDSAYQSGGSGVLSLEQSGTTRSPLVSDMFFKLYATFITSYFKVNKIQQNILRDVCLCSFCLHLCW